MPESKLITCLDSVKYLLLPGHVHGASDWICPLCLTQSAKGSRLFLSSHVNKLFSRDPSMEISAPKDVGSGDHLGKGGGCEYIPQSTLVIDQGYVIPAS